MMLRVLALLAALALPAYANEYHHGPLAGAVSLSGSACSTNVIAKWNGAQTLGCSSLTDDGSTVTSTVPILGADGTAAAPTYSFSDATTTGLFRDSVGVLGVTSGGVHRYQLGANIRMRAVTLFGWSGNEATNAYDTILSRAAAGIVGVTTGIALGTNPASAGAVRLANTATIAARNAANDGDVTIATVNASDEPIFGAGVTQTCDAAGDLTVVGGIISACTAP